MFVKFKRPYFSKDAVSYPARIVVEVPDDLKDVLPSDAEIVKLPEGIEELPDKGPKAIPGFGAQPVHEQELALLGANETHLIAEATGGEAATPAVVTDENVKGKSEGTVQTPANKGEPAKTSDDKAKK